MNNFAFSTKYHWKLIEIANFQNVLVIIIIPYFDICTYVYYIPYMEAYTSMESNAFVYKIIKG